MSGKEVERFNKQIIENGSLTISGDLRTRTPTTLNIEADRIMLREREVEIVSLTVSEFLAKFDRIIFQGADGVQTAFIKEDTKKYRGVTTDKHGR